MVRPIRSQQMDLQSAIRQTAWRQMAETGAAGLSLRGIARELKITAPAIYNHYPSRDDLVTALIAEAYSSLGDAQAAAYSDLSAGDHAGRLRAVGTAYRSWALAYPQRYQLIFGTPIPGYQCPIERTQKAAAYALASLVAVLEDARLDGRLRKESRFTLGEEMRPAFEGWQLLGVPTDFQSFSLAVLIWSRVHGLVSLEIGSQLPPMGPDAGILYAFEIENMVNEYIA